MMIRDGNEKLNGRSKPSSPLALELNVVGLPMHTRNFIPGREQSARGNSHDFRFALYGFVFHSQALDMLTERWSYQNLFVTVI